MLATVIMPESVSKLFFKKLSYRLQKFHELLTKIYELGCGNYLTEAERK